MKRLLIICPYPEGEAQSQRLKYEQYFDAFSSAGWEITVKPFILPAFWKVIYRKGHFLQKVLFTLRAYIQRFLLLSEVSRYDAVFVHLWGTPFGPSIFERLLRKKAKRIIYDIDDLVYLKDVKSKVHPIVSLVKGKRKIIYLMKHADHVITSSPFLNDFVKRYNSNTTYISATVDTGLRYKVVNTYRNDKILTIGWSGSIFTSKYFYLLTNVFKRLRKSYDFRLLVIGDDSVSIEGLTVEAVSWQESYEIEKLQQLDIGVYPLPDEEWVYGKSGLKAIQYMALGIPTVATGIGAICGVIENEVSGLLVHSEDEWVAAIARLIENPLLRKEIGLNGRQKVERCYSIEATKEKYLSILEGKCVTESVHS